jgi:hypothetical protein
VVEEVAAVRVRVGLGDREAESRSLAAAATLEALEQARHEVVGDALACVRDEDSREAVLLERLDPDRRQPVAEGV